MKYKNFSKNIYEKLIEHGLAELPVLQRCCDHLLLGHLSKRNGRLVFRNSGILKNLDVEHASGCWDIGLLGALTILEGEEWDSLSFVGAEHCVFPVEMAHTRKNNLEKISISHGSSIYNFRGSFYRAFEIILDANHTPIVLPTPVLLRSGEVGLAVTDFRKATLPVETLSLIHSMIRAAIMRKTDFSVEEIQVEPGEFGQLFHDYSDLPAEDNSVLRCPTTAA